MAYNALNNLIDAYIYPNGVQAITGSILNNVLKTMVSQLGGGYNLMGIAGPASSPAVNDEPLAYFAATAGTYTNFDGIVLAAGEVAVLLTSGNGSWSKQTIYNVPTGTADLANTAGFITSAVNSLVNYYTKTEIDTALAGYTTTAALATALADYYNKAAIDAQMATRYTKSEVDTKLADYYKKTETYDKDEVDSIVAALSRQEYIVAWDGSSAPVVADIPAGVTVTYNATPYTGTLAASASTVNKIYMVWNGTAYDMYCTSQDGGFSWVPMGTTTVDLSQYATKAEVSQLEAKVTEIEKPQYNFGNIAEYYKTKYIEIDTNGFAQERNPSEIFDGSYKKEIVRDENGFVIEKEDETFNNLTPFGGLHPLTKITDGSQHCALPSILSYNGVLYMTYKKGSAHVSADGVSVCRYSFDNGNSWSAEIVLSEPTSEDGFDVTWLLQYPLVKNNTIVFCGHALFISNGSAQGNKTEFFTMSFSLNTDGTINTASAVKTRYQTISGEDNNFGCGGAPVIIGGVYYYPVYDAENNNASYIIKTEDFSSFQKVSKIADNTNEASLSLLHGDIVALARNTSEQGDAILLRSNDVCVSWSQISHTDGYFQGQFTTSIGDYLLGVARTKINAGATTFFIMTEYGDNIIPPYSFKHTGESGYGQIARQQGFLHFVFYNWDNTQETNPAIYYTKIEQSNILKYI